MDAIERLHVELASRLSLIVNVTSVFRRYRAIVDVLEQVHVAYGIDLTDFFGRKTSRRCVDAVAAPLHRILGLLVAFRRVFDVTGRSWTF